MAPGYLLAAVLVLWAAPGVGDRGAHPIRSVVLGSAMIGGLGGIVCALY
jgi:hypothetical protein